MAPMADKGQAPAEERRGGRGFLSPRAYSAVPSDGDEGLSGPVFGLFDGWRHKALACQTDDEKTRTREARNSGVSPAAKS